MSFNKENFYQEGNSEEFFFARTNPLANAANAEILKIEDCGGCCDIQLDMYIGTVEGTTTVEFNTPTDDYDTKYIKVQITDGQGNFVTAVGTGLVDELILDTSGLNGSDWSVIIEISIGESDLLGCDCTKKFSFAYNGTALSIDTELTLRLWLIQFFLLLQLVVLLVLLLLLSVLSLTVRIFLSKLNCTIQALQF